MTIAVFGLCYGNYPHLSQRLITSWDRWRHDDKLRFHIGLNDVCEATKATVKKFSGDDPQVHVYAGKAPYYKYPIMRTMFQNELSQDKPADYFMWFDDDSYILPDAPDTFFDDVAYRLVVPDMLGSIWYIGLTLAQQAFISAQPWYTARPLPLTTGFPFITGGWWAIKSEIVKKHGWPPPYLEHNGGDVLLGALCHQQNYEMCNYTAGVGINCDDSGRCSSAPRRGFSQPPIGTNYLQARRNTNE